MASAFLLTVEIANFSYRLTSSCTGSAHGGVYELVLLLLLLLLLLLVVVVVVVAACFLVITLVDLADLADLEVAALVSVIFLSVFN